MTGVILEIASGSGEHIVHFARNFPALVFQPSDPEPDARLSVAAWVKATGVTNVRAPIALDASHSVWPIASADGIICINMVHISPWEATLGLIKGAAAILPPAIAALSLRSIQTRRVRNGPEQPSIRPEPSRSQPELGSARPRSGCRDGAIRWILGSGYHRNARKQSERGVPPNVIVSLRGRPASERPLFGICKKLEFWRHHNSRRRSGNERRCRLTGDAVALSPDWRIGADLRIAVVNLLQQQRPRLRR